MARRMRGYDDAQARQIFRDLIDMPADGLHQSKIIKLAPDASSYACGLSDIESFKCFRVTAAKDIYASVKYEEVYLRAYESVSEARTSIGRYLDFYNPASQHPSVYVIEENRLC